MRNYLTVGPVRLRIGSKQLASWGFPRLVVGGFSAFSRSNSGHFVLASYHPKNSHTWLWTIWIGRRDPMAKKLFRFDTVRRGQWQDYIMLPFGREIRILHQKRMLKTPRVGAQS